MRASITLAAVARESGVSVATVSKVLNGRPDVAEATRRRVLRQLRDSGYTPPGDERAARRVRQSVEVRFSGPPQAYSMAVLDGILSAGQGAGLDIVVSYNDGLDPHEVHDPQRLARLGRAGAIFITMDLSADDLSELQRDEFPVVLIDPLTPRSTGCVSIGATNFAGGGSATEHLIHLGHRRIGHAGGPLQVACADARLAGYAAALRRAGLPYDDSLITHCAFEYQAGRAAVMTLLNRPDRPTAIVAASDETALGVVEAARSLGLRVPEDLSVVGFDDTMMASRSAPQLTTVAQPLHQMGRTAVESLVRMLDLQPVANLHVELATHLVVRGSTAPPATETVDATPRTA